MRSATVTMLVVVACGVVALVLLGTEGNRDVAFSLGVVPSTPITVKPGQELCQGVVTAEDDFDAVRLQVGTFERPGGPFRVALQGAGGSRVGGGEVRGSYADNAMVAVPVGPIRQGTRFTLCTTNTGRRAIAPYGGAALASRSTEGTLDGQAIAQDMSADFMRAEPASLLSLAPEIAERASLWHGSWIGSWTVWLLAACVLIGVPALLLLALRAGVR